jgi:hypothetical protein
MAVKKKKLVERTMRGARAAKGLVEGTQVRVQRALGLVALGTYNTNHLLDDTMEQWTDIMDAVLPSSTRSGTPTVFFISNAQVPENQTVGLVDSVQAGQIERSELAGIAKVGAGTGVATPILVQNTAATGYQLRDPDTNDVIVAAGKQELDEVVVEILAMPANPGTYRAVLHLGRTKVLAEVIVVRT